MLRRKDNKGRVLKDGEYQRANGSYEYRWRENGKRYSIYGGTLEELRRKENDLLAEQSRGIRADARTLTINDIYRSWVQLKKGLKENTFKNYQYMYEQFVQDDFGNKKLYNLKRSDVRRFYNWPADERGLKVTTIDNIHTVLHQVLDLAVEDEYIRNNPSDQALKELRQMYRNDSSQQKALTMDEHQLLIRFLSRNTRYHYWLPLITIMIEGGLRVGEATGLRCFSCQYLAFAYQKTKG